MSIFISILDAENSYVEESARAEEIGRQSFKISKTDGNQRLYIDRVKWVDGHRQYERILSVNLKTGLISAYNLEEASKEMVEAALNKASEAVSDVEAAYVGVFNKVPD